MLAVVPVTLFVAPVTVFVLVPALPMVLTDEAFVVPMLLAGA